MTNQSLLHLSRLLIVIGMFSISVSQLSNCTRPSENNIPELILETLRSIPEIPVPIETDENRDHSGFIWTKQYCTDVIHVRNFLRDLTSNLTDPIKNGSIWQWLKVHSDGESYTVFSASWGDTIHFQATYHGSAYSSSFFSHTLTGWVHRQSGNGMFTLGPDYELGWFIRNSLAGFGASTLGYGISINELENGGKLYVDSTSEAIVIFEATWDGLGHGSSTSGDW